MNLQIKISIPLKLKHETGKTDEIQHLLLIAVWDVWRNIWLEEREGAS